MSARLLAVLIVLSNLALLLAFGGVVVAISKRRWRPAIVWVIVGGLPAIVVGLEALQWGINGAHVAWYHTVDPVRRFFAEREKAGAEAVVKRAEIVAARKALVDPALLASAPDNFFTYDGFRDWWRLPLVFPFQLVWIDTFETAHLQRYKEGDIRDPNESSEGCRASITSPGLPLTVIF